MFDPQKTADAITEGQRFVQLMHGVEWLLTLSEAARQADAVCKESADRKAQLDQQIIDSKAAWDKKEAEIIAAQDALKAQHAIAMGTTADDLAKAKADADAAKLAMVDELEALRAKCEQAKKDHEAKLKDMADKEAAAQAALAAVQKSVQDIKDKHAAIAESLNV